MVTTTATDVDVSEFVDRVRAHLERLATAGVQATPDDLTDALNLAMPVPSRWAERLGPVYVTGQLQRLLPGVGAPSITDEAVRDRRRTGRLIGVRTSDRRWVWPAWQFDERAGRLVVSKPILELWRLLPWADGSEWELVAWMTGARRDLDGEAPVDHVRARGVDDRVRRAAARFGARVTA